MGQIAVHIGLRLKFIPMIHFNIIPRSNWCSVWSLSEEYAYQHQKSHRGKIWKLNRRGIGMSSFNCGIEIQ